MSRGRTKAMPQGKRLRRRQAGRRGHRGESRARRGAQQLFGHGAGRRDLRSRVKEVLKQRMHDEKLTRDEEDSRGGAVEDRARRSNSRDGSNSSYRNCVHAREAARRRAACAALGELAGEGWCATRDLGAVRWLSPRRRAGASPTKVVAPKERETPCRARCGHGRGEGWRRAR